MRVRIPANYIPLIATAAVLAGLYVLGCVSFTGFASPAVLVNLVGDNAFLGVTAIGATFVILSGGIDLSVGAVVAFTSIFIASLLERGSSPLVAIALALASGALFGTVMGFIIQVFRLPPFLVTLAGMFLARGAGFIVHPESLAITHPFFSQTADKLAITVNDRLSIPFTATSFVVFLIVGIFTAHYTRFGRYIYALGGDEQSATLMGLPVARTKVLTYTASGFCSALAGVVFVFYMQSGNPASCVGLELDAIAAVVIGGTLLSGGVGFMAGTAMGVLILGLIRTLIDFKGNVNTWWTPIVVGLLVLAFILVQNLVSTGSKKFRALAG